MGTSTSFILLALAFIVITGGLAIALMAALRRQHGLQTKADEAQARINEAQAKIDEMQSKVNDTQTKLDQATIRVHQAERDEAVMQAKMEAEAQALRTALEQEQRMLADAKAQMIDSFKSMAASALEGNNRQFLELAKSVLAKESEVSKGDLEKRQQAIDSLLKPLQTTLTTYQTQATEMERERQKAYANVETELRRVVETSTQLNAQTQALKDALKRPHVRGRWGEVQLKNCIELAAMSEYCDVSFQDQSGATDDDGGQLRPDMTVKMPGGRIVVVDAKTPLDAFLSSLDATTDEQRTLEMARHGQIVKNHVKRLSERAYHEHLKESPDFTVMFLPNESFLYAALETQSDLVEYALTKKILIATPPTLIGLLKVIRFGWTEARLAQNAKKISEAGTELHKRVVEFVETFESVGKHLEKAKAEYDKGRYRLHSKLIVQTKRMEVLGAKSNKELPENEDLLLLDAAAADDTDVAELNS